MMEGTNAKKSINRQPRYCKHGWTDGHEDLVVIAAAYGDRSHWDYLMNHTYIHTNDNSDQLAFPKNIRGYARDRRQAFQRKRKAVAPVFSQNIYKFLRGNEVIDLLRERATTNPTMVIPPTTRRSSSNRHTPGAGDASIDASFDNANGNVVNTLSTGVSRMALTPPRKYTPKELQKLWEGYIKAAVQEGHVFLLRETYDADMNYNFQVSVGPSKLCDRGVSSLPWIHLKYRLQSLKDFDALKMTLSFSHAHPDLSEAGTTPVISFTRRSVSYADTADQPRYAARAVANDTLANTKNKKFKACTERNVKQQNKIVEANGGQRPSEKIVLVTNHFLLPIDKSTGCPRQGHNAEWQGKVFSNKPTKPFELKKSYVPCAYNDEDTACGKKSGEGKRHYAYWEFPLLGPKDEMIGEETNEVDYSEAELEAMTERMQRQGN